MTARMTPAELDLAHRNRLAQRMVSVAVQLACLVRDEPAEAIGEFLAALTGEESRALIIVLAAMVPVDQPVADLLDWVSWDDRFKPPDGRAEPVTLKREYKRVAPVRPCGTPAAYSRHYRRGEDPCDECKAMKRERDAGRDKKKKKAAA